eukprot:3636183-Alexandrium_andersonii.AAC.1
MVELSLCLRIRCAIPPPPEPPDAARNAEPPDSEPAPPDSAHNATVPKHNAEPPMKDSSAR